MSDHHDHHDHHHHHHHDRSGLTRNQNLVFGALEEAHGPLTAYTILDKLRVEGFRAPLQVYRALEKLVEMGMVHRLESLNAFVACRHPSCEDHASTAFAICETCGSVTEFADEEVSRRLGNWAKGEGFVLHKTVIELRGLCRSCKEAAAAQ